MAVVTALGDHRGFAGTVATAPSRPRSAEFDTRPSEAGRIAVALRWTVDAMAIAQGRRPHALGVPAVVELRIRRDSRISSSLDGQLHIDVIRTVGSDPSYWAGDLQTLDNISARHAWRLYRFYWQIDDHARHVEGRVGEQGYDQSFDLGSEASDLLNSSFGQQPTFSQSRVPI